MPALPRVLQKIFGSALASASNIAKIGSLAAGAPAYTNDVAQMQSLVQYLSGFNGINIGNGSPAKQDMNALFYMVTQQLAYILQTGIPEWEIGTEYYQFNVVRRAGGLYTCLVNTLTGSDPAIDSNNWASGLVKLQALVNTGGATAININGAGQIIQFNTEVSDPFNCFAPGTFKYTAPVRGDYRVSAMLQVDNVSGAAGAMEMSLRAVKTGGVVLLSGGESVANPPGGRWYPKLVGGVTLAAAETLEIQLSCTDGVNAGTVNVSNSSLAIERI